jgi:hypothetical protein
MPGGPSWFARADYLAPLHVTFKWVRLIDYRHASIQTFTAACVLSVECAAL